MNRVPPWLRPWRSRAFWAALVLWLVLLSSGVLHSLEHAWRSSSIALARAIKPVVPLRVETEHPLPLCLLFGTYRENYGISDDPYDKKDWTMPVQGRIAEDPREMSRRMALLLAGIAALPENQRPSAIGIDFVFPRSFPETDAYFAEAISRLDNVYLGATEEPGANGIPIAVYSNETLLKAADGVALDTLQLPSWSSPGSRSRLSAPLVTPYNTPDGNLLAPMGVALAAAVNPGVLDRFGSRESIPIYYWNLYYPGRSSEEVSELSWLGLWPAQPALYISNYVTPWAEGESPKAWLDRVAEEFATDSGDAFGATLDVGPLVAGRIVLIGAGHPYDLTPTPFTSVLYQSPSIQRAGAPRSPGVVLHAMTITSLLEGLVPWRFNERLPALFCIVIMLVGAAAWIVGFRYPLPFTAPLLLLIPFIALVIDVFANAHLNLWIDPVYPMITALLFHPAGAISQFQLMRQSRFRTREWVKRLMPATSNTVIGDDDSDLIMSAGEALASKPESAWRTVLRTDMAGYTPLTRGLEQAGRSDLVLSTVSDFFLTAIDIIDKHDGQVTDLTGDGVVAAFTQKDPGEQASRAIEAARQISSLMPVWRAKTEKLLRAEGLEKVPIPGVRIAIGASETSFRFVGNERQQRALFFGGAFVLAARIEAAIKRLPLPAGGDSLRRMACDENTARNYFAAREGAEDDFHRHEPVPLQGFDQPQTVFEYRATAASSTANIV